MSLSCKIIENPTWDSIKSEARRVDAILILPSIEQEEIDKIVNFYNNPNIKIFKVVYIHKYTDINYRLETVFGMIRDF